MFSFGKSIGFATATAVAAASLAFVAQSAKAAPASVTTPDAATCVVSPAATATVAPSAAPFATTGATSSAAPSVTPTVTASPAPATTATPDPSFSPTPTPIIKPASVTALVADTTQLAVLNLAWQQPVKDGIQPITDYRVQYKFDDFGSWLTWKHQASCLTSLPVTDLPLGVGITFSVRPVTANAVGAPTTIHLITPTPSTPVGLTVPEQQQYRFVAATWNARTAPKYGYLPLRDCANWASQSLLLRGLTTTGKWHGRQSRTIAASMAWISSTRLRDYLVSTKKFTRLNDTQRAQVAIGDIVQFDWWNTGAEEHTGVVTAIQNTAAGIKIYYASHTAHGMWWSVDRSIKVVYPGATVSYLHLN